MRKSALLCSLAFALAVFQSPVTAAPLKPAAHHDFGHYTFALTWQPGLCSTGEGCLPTQPKTPLIGLHGLWASLPQSLARTGVVPQEWWQRGCDYFHHSDAPPALRPNVKQQLERDMPRFKPDLLTHEYDKHVQCFRFDANAFFATELAMRNSVVTSSFGRYLVRNLGHDVSHRAVESAFDTAYATNKTASLQLQCENDAAGRSLLTQIWITIRADRLSAFPKASSLVNSAIHQDTCPGTFRIPGWRASAGR